MSKKPLDIQILLNGPICKYFKNTVLNKDLQWFEHHHYQIFDLDVQLWTPQNLHLNLKVQLGFPEYYGENIHAFNDCLRDLCSSYTRGLILVFRNFDDLVDYNKDICEDLLEVVAVNSYRCLVNGQRFICLIQSKDPDLNFEKIGGISPQWNSAEWFDKHRNNKN